MHLLLALGLLLAGDEAETARDALIKALAALDRPAADRACASLVKINDEHCPDYLLAAFRAGIVQVNAFEKDRQKIVKDMKEAEGTKDKDGKVLKAGDSNKWKQLQYDLDFLNGKID